MLRGLAEPLISPDVDSPDWGLVGAEVVLVDRDLLAAGCKLVERMVSMDGELVTVLLLGQDAPDGVADTLIEHLRTAHPEVEAVVYAGGVPECVRLVGVE